MRTVATGNGVEVYPHTGHFEGEYFTLARQSRDRFVITVNNGTDEAGIGMLERKQVLQIMRHLAAMITEDDPE